jgi:Reverse transcriptase (RNA-dependent DNA polymerase)
VFVIRNGELRLDSATQRFGAMADRQSTNRFGLDPAELKKLNWKLATRRILVDVRSDFIYAPHISNVFRHAADALIEEVRGELKRGQFGPGAPVTIDVPKSSRVQVLPRGSRGPTFSRPGSILLPKDRLIYQVFADTAAPIIEKATDRSRSFSHRLLPTDSAEMFEASRTSWNRMQQALNRLSKLNRGYVLKADVANCFASVNQHILVNHLESVGYPGSLKNALDAMLVLYTGDRSSRGLLQGVFPSDLFGNFYLNPIDQMFEDLDVPSVRYVDDIYVFLPRRAYGLRNENYLRLKILTCMLPAL